MDRAILWPGIVFCLVMSAWAEARTHEIVVDLDLGGDNPRLYVLDSDRSIRTSYPIAGPRITPRCLVHADVRGSVTAVHHRALWYPTESTKASVYRLTGRHLKNVYGPDEPGNALGGRKINVRWDRACLQPTVRIHATNEPSLVHKQARVSRNCIRLTKEDWDDLAQYVEEGTVVTVTADRK